MATLTAGHVTTPLTCTSSAPGTVTWRWTEGRIRACDHYVTACVELVTLYVYFINSQLDMTISTYFTSLHTKYL